jgi:hypothetical protein
MTEPHDGDIGGDLPPLDPELAAWLASDPSPAMPEAVWARIEDRLAAEPPLVPAGVVDLSAERSARRPRRVLPLLAGAAGLALVGAVVVPALRSADPAPVADAPLASTPAEAAAAVPPASPMASAPTAAPPAPRAMVATGTDYTADGLQTQAVSLLASAGMQDSNAIAAAMTTDPDAAAMGGPGLMATPESLAECLARLGLPEGSVPLVVDTATVNGQMGSLIVTWHPGLEANPSTVHVVAVGQDCTDGDAAAALHWDVALP